jgi:hypothetical protein
MKKQHPVYFCQKNVHWTCVKFKGMATEDELKRAFAKYCRVKDQVFFLAFIPVPFFALFHAFILVPFLTHPSLPLLTEPLTLPYDQQASTDGNWKPVI